LEVAVLAAVLDPIVVGEAAAAVGADQLLVTQELLGLWSHEKNKEKENVEDKGSEGLGKR
jgi:hypothetical protein